MKIKELSPLQRPREKAMREGLDTLSDRELLALFVRNGTRSHSALDLADEILKICGNIQGLASASVYQLMHISGIKAAKATEILGVVEMSKRIVRPVVSSQISINQPNTLMDWLNYEIGYEKQEQFLMVCLNQQNQILGHKILFKGTIDRSIVHPRDVFREASAMNASRLLLVHNHPGTTMRASEADKHVTDIMVQAGQIVGIEILDHLIVSYGMYFSIKTNHPELFRE